MKKLTLIIALICSISAFSATRYLVELGTGGAAIAWRTAGTNEKNVNLNTLSVTLSAWVTDRNLATPTLGGGSTFNAGDEIWIAGGLYTVSGSISLKADVSLYGSFAGNETAISQRMKASTTTWDFTNQTIIDGNSGNYRGVVTNVSTTSCVIDGVQIKNFTVAAGNTNGVGAYLQANCTMQNCIVSNNSYTGTVASEYCRGVGVQLKSATVLSAKLLDSYIHDNTNTTGTGVGAIGGGVAIWGSATVKGCTIQSNSASSQGGGIVFTGDFTATSYNSGGNLENCIIKSNTAGNYGSGIVGSNTVYKTENVTIKNCQIIENTTSPHSCGAYLNFPATVAVSIDGCLFSGNAVNGNSTSSGYGSALSLISGDYITNPIKNCVFRDNYAATTTSTSWGSTFHAAVIATMQNCIFANNTAIGANLSIAKFYITGSKVYNCTFAKNLTNGSGRALNFSSNATPAAVCTATNCLFWGNISATNCIGAIGTSTATYIAQDGGTAPTGAGNRTDLNSATNNTFTSPISLQGASTDATTKTQVAAADWSLMSGCPAINNGTDLSGTPNLITTDILGNARPTGASAVDMGAYESGYTAQTITFGALAAKTYGDAAFDPGATSATSGTNPITYTSSNTGVATVSGSTITIVGKGSTNITASQAGNSTYSAATSVTQQLVVNAKTLTITANSANKTYGSTQTTPVTGSSAFTPTGLVGNENIGSVTLTYGSGALAATDAASSTSTITPSVATGGTFNSGNYTITYSTGTLTVAKKALTITADNKSVTYGTASVTGTYTPTGFVNSQDATVIGGSATYSTSYTNTTSAGTTGVTITPIVTGLTATNYSFTPVAGTVTITQATPTLSLASSSVNYNGSTQAATVNGSVSGSASNVKYDGSSTAPTAVGSYAITADFTPTDGTNYASLTGASAGTFTINATVADAPTIGIATTGDGQASVAFTAPSNNGGSSILDYSVTPYIGATAGTPVTGSGSPIVVTSLTNGTAYTFTVTARNSVGSSLASSSSNAVTPASASSSITVSTNTNVSTIIGSLSPATDVTIDADKELTINADASVKSITVAPRGKLTLSGATLTTVNGVTLQSSSAGTATFVDNNTVSPKTVTGTVEQYLDAARNWYTTSPIVGATVPTGQTYYSYDETGSNTGFTDPATAYWVAVPEGTAINPMKGYIAQPGAPTTLSYTGTFNTDVKTVSLTRTTGKTKEGFNLVANPYPSYLDWALVDTTIATGAKIMSSIWYRTKTTGNAAYTFDTYNGSLNVATNNGATKVTNLIPPMQAFWVRVKEGQTAGTLTFTNAMRSHVDNTLNKFKAPAQKNANQQMLRLQVSNGINADETILCFNPNASNGFDGYDSQKMSNSTASMPEIFTVAGSEQLVINGMNNVTLNQEIPLGFTTGQSNAFSIKATEVSNFDAGTQVILVDNQNPGTQWNLSDGSAYNFSSDITSSNTSRFSLIFKAPSITTGTINNDSETNSVLVYRNANNLITINCVNGIAGQATASVYNAVGQKLEEKSLTSSITVLNRLFTSGVYLVNVTVNAKSTIQKVAIN